MYLVLIAMLALNMSKEVLTAFGIMNNKFVDGNKSATNKNQAFLSSLDQKAQGSPDAYDLLNKRAISISNVSNNLYDFIENLKTDIKKPYEDDRNEETGELPYQSMDKGDAVDEAWFKGDGMSPKGKEVLAAFETYRSQMLKELDNKNEKTGKQINQKFIDLVNNKFNTDDVKREGAKKLWLDFNFKGFPAIASIAKLSAFQSDVKSIETEILAGLLSEEQASQLSFKNYEAMVIPEKPAFFSGENFKGRIVLGRVDANTKPNKVILNGVSIDKKNFQKGGVKIDIPAGNIGENKLEGEFIFMENGKEVPVKISDVYAVVPKPNSATISADKMNVVYRGIPNPMTISFAGISSNKVNASAPGLKKSGKGYTMTPSKGREVTINVIGTLPDGKKVSDKKKFRIKDIPRPQAAVSGAPGIVKKSRNALKGATISAVLEDFVFDLNLKVNSFKFKVPGQATISVNGSKLNSRAKAALQRAKRGDQVTIFELKAAVVGSPIKLKPASPVIIELSN
jgi:gliding motility-associated protein GldM